MQEDRPRVGRVTVSAWGYRGVLVELAVAESNIPSRMLLLQCNIHGQDHAQGNMRAGCQAMGRGDCR